MRTQVLRYVVITHLFLHVQGDISNNKSLNSTIQRDSSPALQPHFCVSVGLL